MPTSGKLHVEPVWLDPMRLDQVDENAHIELAKLDDLGEEEALRRRDGSS
jgi:hypothetical protein